ncbi:MAG: site-specific integrase [Defluviitaleaceae bacterium]|nr:site-specific integrase [Defluviitaleaceae bacterium]
MSKRTNGEGTVWQDKRGLWRAEITLGYEEVNGKKKRIKKGLSSKDRETLLKKMNAEQHRVDRNIVVKNSDYTVTEWVKFWLENYKMYVLKPTTYDSYEYALTHHIRTAVGNLRLNKVRSDNIQQLYNQMHKRGLSSNTIRIVHATLSQAFDQAIKNELMYVNPCGATVRPKSSKRKAEAMTASEQEAFTKHCGSSTFHVFFIFLLHTGLRVGEGQALTWRDIDFKEKCISINKTASTVKNRDEGASARTKIIIDSTKTAHGVRSVPMNSTVEKILRTLESGRNNNIFIFSSRNGTMLSARNITRSYKILLESAGLPSTYTVHTTRHTFATRLLEKGVNPKTASDLLGHSSVQITLDLYSHVLPNVKTDAVSLLD